MIGEKIAIFIMGILLGTATVLYFMDLVSLYKFAIYREKILRHREINQYINIKRLNRLLKKTAANNFKKVYALTKEIEEVESQLKLTRSELNALLSLEEKL